VRFDALDERLLAGITNFEERFFVRTSSATLFRVLSLR